jgi:predicted metalloendopeptidase
LYIKNLTFPEFSHQQKLQNFPKELLSIPLFTTADFQFTAAVMINEKEWLDAKTKDAALLKLAKMREYVGAVDTVYDVQKLDQFHESLQLKPKEPVFQMEQKVKKFNKKMFNAELLNGFGVTEVNAFNDLMSNIICKLIFRIEIW